MQGVKQTVTLFSRSVVKQYGIRLCLVREYNANRCMITRIKQQKYTRVYPTVVAYPDGSTTTIRYSEPRKLLKLPLFLDDLNEIEKKAFMARRRPREEIKIKEDTTKIKYDASKYLKYIKKK